ncbi:MAG: phage major capsid protein [Geminicoccaceae bacterium]
MALRDLLEQRARTVTEMRAIADKPEGDGGDLSDDQSKRFDALKSELAKTETRIERQQLVDDAERRMAAPTIISGRGDGQYEQRAREFSLVKAILASCGDIPSDGLEREISSELRARTGRTFSGIAVPDEAWETRTLLSSTVPELVPTQHRPDLFVDLRRSAMVTGTLGATVLGGLVGDQEIPRQIASSTAQHVAEDAALTETDADTNQITLSPKTVGALTSFSRRALINAQPSIDQLVRRDLAAVIGRAVDFQALLGDGLGNTPTGVANEPGLNVASLAGPTWAQVLAFVAAIQSADADIGAMGWTLNPNAVAKLRATTKVSTDAGAGFLMDSPTEMAGFRVAPTTAIPEITGAPNKNQVFFGAWSQLLIGLWSGVDLLANPFSDTAFPRGRVQVRALQDYDVAVRHGESFARAIDLPL